MHSRLLAGRPAGPSPGLHEEVEDLTYLVWSKTLFNSMRNRLHPLRGQAVLLSFFVLAFEKETNVNTQRLGNIA